MEKVGDICMSHPFWGSRRVRNWLKRREGLSINRKRVQRIMREQNLILKPRRKRASREGGRRKPVPTRAKQWWGIDMTKFLVGPMGWVYLVSVVDWYTRKVVGYSVGLNSRTELWTEALNRAVLEEFPKGSREKGLFLMSDNGSQPTSGKFMKVSGLLGIQQTFTSYNNPKGNANTERWFRTFKEDCLWQHEWDNFSQVKKDIASWIDFYNNQYCHSALNGLSPKELIEKEPLTIAA